MTETCPFCQNEVLFINSTCPSCRNNRDDVSPETTALRADEVLQRLEEVVLRKAKAAEQDAARVRARQHVTVGAVWGVGGLFITLSSHAKAVYSEGDTYMLMWGPMIYGGLRLLCGLGTFIFSPVLK